FPYRGSRYAADKGCRGETSACWRELRLGGNDRDLLRLRLDRKSSSRHSECNQQDGGQKRAAFSLEEVMQHRKSPGSLRFGAVADGYFRHRLQSRCGNRDRRAREINDPINRRSKRMITLSA